MPSTGTVQPGQILGGRYALTHLLARGGMADVWQANDTLLQRQVAVKILHPHLAADESFVARFRTEAVAAARLHHRSIVAIFDTCSENGVEAIVMELIRGHTLREEIDTHGPLDPTMVISIGADVADALEASHRAGLIHRDVKPANILLCADQRVMVTDFGIAKFQDTTDRTQLGTMLGSVKYLSPEQVEGSPVDGRSDVYSLGVVLYETLTGQVPFIADTPAATALARLHTVPVRPHQVRPGIPLALDDVVMKALAREPDHRFASSAELEAALLATRGAPLHVDPDITEVSPRPTPAARAVPPPRAPDRPDGPRPGRPTGPPAPSRRGWGAALVVLVMVAVALIVAAVLVLRTNTGKELADQVTHPTGTDVTAAPAKFTSARAFDPLGDLDEDGSHTANAIDGDPTTYWHTEYYTDRKFSSNAKKTGVGLVVGTDQAQALHKLTVTSPTQDWASQIFVSDQLHDTLADWGEPVATKAGIAGDVTFDLKGINGRYVLIWITDLGTGPPAPGATGNANVTVLIDEVSLGS